MAAPSARCWRGSADSSCRCASLAPRSADVERIRNLKVADPQGRMIPLSQLADIVVEDGPAQISRENIHRKINVEVQRSRP